MDRHMKYTGMHGHADMQVERPNGSGVSRCIHITLNFTLIQTTTLTICIYARTYRVMFVVSINGLSKAKAGDHRVKLCG